MHDAYIGGRSENNIKCVVVHNDLGWKNRTTQYNCRFSAVSLALWVIFSVHSCGTYSVLSRSPSIHFTAFFSVYLNMQMIVLLTVTGNDLHNVRSWSSWRVVRKLIGWNCVLKVLHLIVCKTGISGIFDSGECLMPKCSYIPVKWFVTFVNMWKLYGSSEALLPLSHCFCSLSAKYVSHFTVHAGQNFSKFYATWTNSGYDYQSSGIKMIGDVCFWTN